MLYRIDISYHDCRGDIHKCDGTGFAPTEFGKRLSNGGGGIE